MLNINIQLHSYNKDECILDMRMVKHTFSLYSYESYLRPKKKIGMFRAPRPTLAKPPHDPNFFLHFQKNENFRWKKINKKSI